MYEERVKDLSIEDALALAKNPDNIAAEGSYGEGKAYTTRALFDKLKKAVQDGKLSLTAYSEAADPLAKSFAQQINGLVAQGQKGLATQLGVAAEKANFVKLNADRNDYSAIMPFNRQEYAKLPDAVLPTQADVDKGLWDPNLAPFERYQSGQPGADGIKPEDVIGGSIPTNIDLRTDRGLVETEGERQAKELQSTLDTQRSLRDADRTKLAEMLSQRQEDLFNRAVPGLAENANTQGILRSTGFGDLLSKKYADLTADTQFQLQQQGLSDSDKYTSGLSDVVNTRLGLQNAGLQRQFSLDDASRSLQMAQQLAQASQTGSSGKTNGEKWAQGLSTGAQVVGAGAKIAAL